MEHPESYKRRPTPGRNSSKRPEPDLPLLPSKSQCLPLISPLYAATRMSARSQISLGTFYVPFLIVLCVQGDICDFRTLIFDVSIYLGAQPPLIAALRLYNEADENFDDVGVFFVNTTVSTNLCAFVQMLTFFRSRSPYLTRSPRSIPRVSTKTSMRLKGQSTGCVDIYIQVFSTRSHTCFFQYVKLKDIRAARTKQFALLLVGGTVKNVNTEASSFDIDVNHWMPFNAGNSFLPVQATIQDSPRFKNKKPLPSVGGIVHTVGKLVATLDTENNHRRLAMDVDTVSFLGRSASPTKPTNQTPGMT